MAPNSKISTFLLYFTILIRYCMSIQIFWHFGPTFCYLFCTTVAFNSYCSFLNYCIEGKEKRRVCWLWRTSRKPGMAQQGCGFQSSSRRSKMRTIRDRPTLVYITSIQSFCLPTFLPLLSQFLNEIPCASTFKWNSNLVCYSCN